MKPYIIPEGVGRLFKNNPVPQGPHTHIFTNGCFDLFHAGHLTLLLKASKEEENVYLTVAINSDESVAKLKGAGRPIIPEYERALIVSSYDFVDRVIIFHGTSVIPVLTYLKPDVLIKGGSPIEGKELVESYGGKVIQYQRYRYNKIIRSTSDIIHKIRNKCIWYDMEHSDYCFGVYEKGNPTFRATTLETLLYIIKELDYGLE